MSLLNVLAKDQDVISYRKELNPTTGSVTATILLQQIIYRFTKNDNKPFYKFIEPCKHKLYKDGDSWTEELGFGVKEFKNAYKKLEDKTLVSKKTNMDRVTFYELNVGAVGKVLNGIYIDAETDDTKSADGHLDNSESFDTETTTETTTENIKNKQKAFSFTLGKKMSFENLSAEYKTKLEEFILSTGFAMSYTDFESACVAKGYQYKNFMLAYGNWNKNSKAVVTQQGHNQQVPKDPFELYAEYRKQGMSQDVAEVRVIRETEMKYPATAKFVKATGEAEYRLMMNEIDEIDIAGHNFSEDPDNPLGAS